MSVGVDYEWNDPSLKRFEEVANMEVDDIPVRGHGFDYSELLTPRLA